MIDRIALHLLLALALFGLVVNILAIVLTLAQVGAVMVGLYP